jgi:hypothetical protein
MKAYLKGLDEELHVLWFEAFTPIARIGTCIVVFEFGLLLGFLFTR